MNYLFLIAAFAIGSLNSYGTIIDEAISRNMVAYEIRGNEKSTHYLKPLICEIQNLTNKEISIEIPAGYILEADDSVYQNFIVNEPLLVKIAPKAKKSGPISAMCIEQSDRVPSESSTYTFTQTIADKPLFELARLIADKNMHDIDGQFMVWTIAEGLIEVNKFVDYELDEEGNIFAIVKTDEGNVGRVSFEKEMTSDLMVRNYKGKLNMSFPFQCRVHMALFNTNGVVVKELYKSNNVPSGPMEIPYQFNTYEFPDEKYKVKLILFDEVIMEREIDTRS